jgi:hypothetical protein
MPVTFECNDDMEDCEFPLPPGKDVILPVNVDGYKEFTRSISVVA